jgi:hypothetical protein
MFRRSTIDRRRRPLAPAAVIAPKVTMAAKEKKRDQMRSPGRGRRRWGALKKRRTIGPASRVVARATGRMKMDRS